MKMDITFGQYVEGNSILHRLDPRAKLIIAILYVVAIFLANNVFSFALIVASAVLITVLSGISPRIIGRGIRPVLILIVFTAVINIFFVRGDHPLVNFYFIHIYREGLVNAAFIIIRIVVLIVCTSLFLTYTTTPIALTDALEQLLSPLKKLRVPVHEFSMMMTIALRFIPTLIDETQKIINAQTARGADFTTGSLIQRGKALIPILIPLFISAFRRADELATAMECRCYTGGEGRTRMNVLKSEPKDWIFFACIVLLGAAVVCLNRFFPLFAVSL